MTPDQARIAALPHRWATDRTHHVQRARDLWAKHTRAPDLRQDQAELLCELHGAPHPLGAVGGLAVGEGKTLCSLLAPTALGVSGPDTVVILPPRMEAHYDAEYDRWSRHYRLTRGHVVPWSRLSTRTADRVLWAYSPKLIVLDEAHLLGSPTARRARTVIRYVVANPDTRVVCLTGTLVRITHPTRVAAMFELALRDHTPLPLHIANLRAVDATLVGEPSSHDRDVTRALYGGDTVADLGHRIRTTPRVVISRSPGQLPVPLHIRKLTPKVPDSIRAAVQRLADAWTLPDGTELATAVELDRAHRSLALGWYRSMVPGTLHPEYAAARLAWGRELRVWTTHRATPGRDTAGDVASAAQCRALPPATLRVWDQWQRAQLEHPPPEYALHWLPYARSHLRGVVRAWCAHGPGIVWVHSRAVQGLLASLGYAVHGAGSDQPKGTPHPVCAMAVHGTGWHAVEWSRALVLEVPTNEVIAEQVIGRIHRQGQQHPCTVDLYTPPGVERLIAVLRARSKAAAQLNGRPGKLEIARW